MLSQRVLKNLNGDATFVSVLLDVRRQCQESFILRQAAAAGLGQPWDLRTLCYFGAHTR